MVSRQVTRVGWGVPFYPIHQTGADPLNEAKASLTDKNPILAHGKRQRGVWGVGVEGGAESGRSGRKNGNKPDLSESDVGATSNFTHSNCSSLAFSMEPLHFSPFTHGRHHPPRPRLPFMQLFAVYGYTEIPLCRRHTLFRKVSRAQ